MIIRQWAVALSLLALCGCCSTKRLPESWSLTVYSSGYSPEYEMPSDYVHIFDTGDMIVNRQYPSRSQAEVKRDLKLSQTDAIALMAIARRNLDTFRFPGQSNQCCGISFSIVVEINARSMAVTYHGLTRYSELPRVAEQFVTELNKHLPAGYKLGE